MQPDTHHFFSGGGGGGGGGGGRVKIMEMADVFTQHILKLDDGLRPILHTEI